MKNIIFEYQGRRYEFNNRNREIIFQSNEFSIHCPKEFLTFMLEKLNTLSTITDICKPYNSSAIEFINCSPYLFTEPSNITFHIGDYLFELKMNQIFSCYIFLEFVFIFNITDYISTKHEINISNCSAI